MAMTLGFVSAILPDLDLDGVLSFAGEHGFGAVEVMCWPVGKAERRYAGVTHLDVSSFDDAKAAAVKAQAARHGVLVSSLGYYPNPLVADEKEAAVYIDHIKKVITASARLGLGVMTTFIGRDHTRNIEDNWALVEERWPSIVKHAEQAGVRIGIENCPMLFSNDEWPGGKNLAISPKLWRRLFERFGTTLGLNYDPSHLVWQFMDPVRPIYDFPDRLYHVHAKDVRILRHKLQECGILDFGWNVPKLPGLGDVDWSAFFAALTEVRYSGPVCIEVEDRAYEGSLDDRKRALLQAKRYLENFV
jgi:sugar phosphate isomerase/epimerase